MGILDVCLQVAHGAGLANAAGREIDGVEIEDGSPSVQKIREGPVLSGLVGQREFRRAFPRIEHRLPPSFHRNEFSLPLRRLWLTEAIAATIRGPFRGSSSVGRASRSQADDNKNYKILNY